jgi:hypothetical protein
MIASSTFTHIVVPSLFFGATLLFFLVAAGALGYWGLRVLSQLAQQNIRRCANCPLCQEYDAEDMASGSLETLEEEEAEPLLGDKEDELLVIAAEDDIAISEAEDYHNYMENPSNSRFKLDALMQEFTEGRKVLVKTNGAGVMKICAPVAPGTH